MISPKPDIKKNIPTTGIPHEVNSAKIRTGIESGTPVVKYWEIWCNIINRAQTPRKDNVSVKLKEHSLRGLRNIPDKTIMVIVKTRKVIL